MSYAIIRLDTEELVREFATLPKSFDVTVAGRNRRIVSPVAVGDEGTLDGVSYRFVEVSLVDWERPGRYYDLAGEDVVFDGARMVTKTRTWAAWDAQRISDAEDTQAAEVADEIVARSLAAGTFALVETVAGRAVTVAEKKAFRDATIAEYKRLKAAG